MRADRDLRLSGYEVYRFGAQELLDAGWESLLDDFLGALFVRYGLYSSTC